MSERKTAEIKLRIEPSRKAQWQQAAADEEIGLSEFIVQACEERRVSGKIADDIKPLDRPVVTEGGDFADLFKPSSSVAPDSAPTKDRDSDWREPKPFNDDYKPWRFSK